MKKFVRLFSALMLGLSLSPVEAASLTDRIGDASFWQTLDWNQAASSLVWGDSNWVSYLGKQARGEDRDRIQQFSLDGTEWQAMLSRREHNSGAPYQLTIYTPAEDTDTDQCDKLYRWAFRHFGSPHIAVDGSYRLPAAAASLERRDIDRHYQWDMGDTRITQECIGQLVVNTEGTPQNVYAASSLRFTQKEAAAELPPLVSAKCTRVLRLSNSSDIPLKMSDIAFLIDEQSQSIRRPDLVPIRVAHVQITNTQVGFSVTLDKSINDYIIDRSSGQLNATMSISGIRAGVVNGQCVLAPLLTAQPE